MTTIHPISRIQVTPKPAAVPSLWNNIYDEIDDRLRILNEGKQDAGTGAEGLAPIDNPVFTGNPRAPTPPPNDSDTSVATTAFVQDAINGLAHINSPAFTGTPTAPTAVPGNSSLQVATTAFVAAAIDASNTGGLGVDQTWQDFTGTRLVNAVYSNTTGRPIAVSFFIWTTTESTAFYLECRAIGDTPWSTIGGVSLYPTSEDGLSMSGIVPTGYQYQIADVIPGYTAFNWYELR